MRGEALIIGLIFDNWDSECLIVCRGWILDQIQGEERLFSKKFQNRKLDQIPHYVENLCQSSTTLGSSIQQPSENKEATPWPVNVGVVCPKSSYKIILKHFLKKLRWSPCFAQVTITYNEPGKVGLFLLV